MAGRKMNYNNHAVEVFNARADIYQEKYMNVEVYADVIDFFCNETAKSGFEILDIACGPGNILKNIENRNSGFQLTGMDLSVEMVRLAKVNVPSATIIQEDCRKLAGFTKQYDGVICNFAIPYLDMNETIQLIEDISRQTKIDGMFLLGFIKGEYKSSRIVRSSTGDELFVHYYEPSFIKELIEKFRFAVFKAMEFQSPNPGQSEADILIISKKLNGL
jgi:2-polyprenyl-3-methyl-5-hydroxy-6-metoxy-1,4-benzoquinol methylase